MLDPEYLPTVAQRILRQQPDFGQAVQHHPVRLRALNGLEYLLGGFAEFEIGGIEQALLLLRIKQAFRRQQFEDFYAVVERPTMRRRALAQFTFGLRQSDVEAFLPGLGALEQELQRHGGLAGAGCAFQQKDVATRKSARQNIVEPPNARFRHGGDRFNRIHVTPQPGTNAIGTNRFPANGTNFAEKIPATSRARPGPPAGNPPGRSHGTRHWPRAAPKAARSSYTCAPREPATTCRRACRREH